MMTAVQNQGTAIMQADIITMQAQYARMVSEGKVKEAENRRLDKSLVRI